MKRILSAIILGLTAVLFLTAGVTVKRGPRDLEERIYLYFAANDTAGIATIPGCPTPWSLDVALADCSSGFSYDAHIPVPDGVYSPKRLTAHLGADTDSANSQGCDLQYGYGPVTAAVTFDTTNFLVIGNSNPNLDQAQETDSVSLTAASAITDPDTFVVRLVDHSGETCGTVAANARIYVTLELERAPVND